MSQGKLNPQVLVFSDHQALSRAVADRVVTELTASVAKTGVGTIVLAGGDTPLPLYRLLASEYRERLPWSRIHVFWGDERYVPATDPANNFGRAQRTLLSRVPIPLSNVHPIPTEMESPVRAAAAYEQTVGRFFRDVVGTEAEWRFNVVLLGLGTDGHTASLFAGAAASEDVTNRVVASLAPVDARPRRRVTMTLQAINAADSAFFLVSGSEKAFVVREILRAQRVPGPPRYPAAKVRSRKPVLWFLDAAAYTPQ